MNEISCEVIQDLIPLCASGAASRATVKMVQEHMKTCDDCRARYESAMGGKRPPRARRWFFAPPREPMETPVRYLRWSILALAGVWMAVFWGGIGVAMAKKLNGFYCIAMIVFLFFPGELATAGIAAAYSQGGWQANWIRMAGYVVAALVLAVMGYEFDARRRDA